MFDCAALYFKLQLDRKTLRDRTRSATTPASNDLMHAAKNCNAAPDVSAAPPA